MNIAGFGPRSSNAIDGAASNAGGWRISKYIIDKHAASWETMTSIISSPSARYAIKFYTGDECIN